MLAHTLFCSAHLLAKPTFSLTTPTRTDLHRGKSESFIEDPLEKPNKRPTFTRTNRNNPFQVFNSATTTTTKVFRTRPFATAAQSRLTRAPQSECVFIPLSLFFLSSLSGGKGGEGCSTSGTGYPYWPQHANSAFRFVLLRPSSTLRYTLNR